ncbi:TolC family outer membrane protein [Methylopila sp. M107]|uniref:TolC family outer membrane protein n=1 Tax=Methylopila sp. M107 TaxID=1101190 RepID=UPI00036DF677|nr:TolC family outer membrane protein [Methylopila sp. M107]
MSTSVSSGRSSLLCAAAALGLVLAFSQQDSARAQTLEQAISRAYAANPTLNAQRANVRAIDEQVPQALSGYRPTVSVTADVGAQYTNVKRKGSGGGGQFAPTGNPATDANFQALGQTLGSLGGPNKGRTYPRSAGIQASQNVFDGFRTKNQVRSAESNILAAREDLRNTEQNVLFDVAQAYMDVLRDYAILDIRKNNVDVLKEEQRAADERFKVGEVTRTDTAQAEARVQGALTAVSQAEAQLNTSRATYRQVVGDEIGRPKAAKSIDRVLPKSLPAAINLSQAQHPAILASLHGIDAATLQIRVFEADLMPQVSLQGSLQRSWDDSLSTKGYRTTAASVVGQLTIPIYQGGAPSSRIRQAKETAGQRRLDADTARDQVRQSVVSAWGTVQGATASIKSAQAQIEANQVALNGVREEAKVGQRTTLDVLNAQQEVLVARESLINAQRDRMVGAYALLSAVGWLSAQKLSLKVAGYDPNVHYDQVRDKWGGLRTPDGR